jgi:Cu-Zn family superoxide dismutase
MLHLIQANILNPKTKRFLMSKQLLITTLFALALTGCACTDNRKPEADKNKDQKNEVADAGIMTAKADVITEAFAIVNPIDDSKVKGKITFTQVPGGVKIVADVDGLKPGDHGFHVHEHGDCGGEHGNSAGGHFNPTNKKHGGPDSAERHVGDFGNITADEKGHGHYERVDRVISLNGAQSIVGRSIIIHADKDDLTTQPTGNSGARVACGKIEAGK